MTDVQQTGKKDWAESVGRGHYDVPRRRPPAAWLHAQRPARACRRAHLSPTACRFARWLLVMNSSSGPRSLFLA